MYIFVKVCLGSSYSIAVSDCNDTSSLEACNCIIRANSPVFTTFYFRFRHWAFWTKLIATTGLKTFQYRLVWACIHKKLIACHSPNFKICVGSRIILPVTLLQPTKTDDRKRSNWPPDVNQIVFHWPPWRSVWTFTARVIVICHAEIVKVHSDRMRQRHVFQFWMNKNITTLLFLRMLSQQQRNDIIVLAARYKIKGHLKCICTSCISNRNRIYAGTS